MSFRYRLRVVRVAAFGFAFLLTGALSSAAFAGDCIGCVVQEVSGKVGIGSASPVAKLDVNGDIRSDTGTYAAGGGCSPNGATVAAAVAASGQNLICTSGLWAVVVSAAAHGSYRMFCTCDTNNSCPCTPACAGGDTTLTTVHNATIAPDPGFGGANTFSLYEIWCLH